VGQVREFLRGGRPHPPESRAVAVIDVNPMQKQQVKVNIQVQRTAETLNQCHRYS
jgi:hypothetical protein